MKNMKIFSLLTEYTTAIHLTVGFKLQAPGSLSINKQTIVDKMVTEKQ